MAGLLLAFPEYCSASFDKMPRMAALTVVVVGSWTAWYWNLRRKNAQQAVAPNHHYRPL
ncbi:hypothetical protein JIN85_19575 [Luteolibacter pohnpeiensis]|uniref:Uncharacterized protein n=1 Tax=Luteolibacter pohnpeiensis TaxID=454153 RepID=A0A934SBS1_9BACT|nr:hypothetical protein [Luteolibacter pohnpeiensis]MBK1884626.1 hypothetical protein [Luteolibacter pohnpeiensis]